MNNKKLVLESGEVFEGIGFGGNGECVNELVFNTSVVGYQEIISDPSNYGEMLCMTYPVIGNYGLTDEDYESTKMTVSGLIVKEYNKYPSNFRYTHELHELMEENNIPGISGVDTREIVRIVKKNGVKRAIICDINKPLNECMEAIKNYHAPKNIVKEISTKKVIHKRIPSYKYTVACIDCGVKRSLITELNSVGCNVVVLPYDSNTETILKYKPNGLFISDGPGNPNDVEVVISTIKTLKGKMPICGVGLGQELIALAYGAKIYKEHVGHNGCNLPVRNIFTGKIEITNQNDLYAIDKKSLENTNLKITHENVIDGVIEGICDLDNMVISIQFNPTLNLDDPDYIFNRFIELMKINGGKR